MKTRDTKIVPGPAGMCCPCCSAFNTKRKNKTAINRRTRRKTKMDANHFPEDFEDGEPELMEFDWYEDWFNNRPPDDDEFSNPER